MIPIGRPFLDYVWSAIADGSFRHGCLVIGPEHDAVRDYYTKRRMLSRVSVDFAIQERPLAPPTPSWRSRIRGDDLFLMITSDKLLPVEAYATLRLLGGRGCAFGAGAHSGGNIPPDRVRHFSIISTAPDGTLIASSRTGRGHLSRHLENSHQHELLVVRARHFRSAAHVVLAEGELDLRRSSVLDRGARRALRRREVDEPVPRPFQPLRHSGGGRTLSGVEVRL